MTEAERAAPVATPDVKIAAVGDGRPLADPGADCHHLRVRIEFVAAEKRRRNFGRFCDHCGFQLINFYEFLSKDRRRRPPLFRAGNPVEKVSLFFIVS